MGSMETTTHLTYKLRRYWWGRSVLDVDLREQTDPETWLKSVIHHDAVQHTTHLLTEWTYGKREGPRRIRDIGPGTETEVVMWRTPANRWAHFLLAVLPAWVVFRFPRVVKMKEHRKKVEVYIPHRQYIVEYSLIDPVLSGRGPEDLRGGVFLRAVGGRLTKEGQESDERQKREQMERGEYLMNQWGGI